ncbi:hypothetical protein ABW21_db0207588 [Orbilia brochopaga]|nr:hypothetical protein ABW21_db0207588 [Drechslerella brochopaga]
MKSEMLYLLSMATTILGDCTSFTTSENWAIKLNIEPGYSFLRNSSIQNQCYITSSGGVSASARFSVAPLTTDDDTLSRFFSVVLAATGKVNLTANRQYTNGKDETPPSYSICGNITKAYTDAHIDIPDTCIPENAGYWGRYSATTHSSSA